jgi:hypothetical protein
MLLSVSDSARGSPLVGVARQVHGPLRRPTTPGMTSPVAPASASRRFTFDPSKTWRRRRCEEIRVLSAMERRYLLDLLAQIEVSGGCLDDELFISVRRVTATGSQRTAKPLSLLVRRGLLALSTKDGKLHGAFTENGRKLIHRWFATKPPDFTTRYPRLYRELGFRDEA